jgi:hypothetical protein
VVILGGTLFTLVGTELVGWKFAFVPTKTGHCRLFRLLCDFFGFLVAATFFIACCRIFARVSGSLGTLGVVIFTHIGFSVVVELISNYF